MKWIDNGTLTGWLQSAGARSCTNRSKFEDPCVQPRYKSSVDQACVTRTLTPRVASTNHSSRRCKIHSSSMLKMCPSWQLHSSVCFLRRWTKTQSIISISPRKIMLQWATCEYFDHVIHTSLMSTQDDLCYGRPPWMPFSKDPASKSFCRWLVNLHGILIFNLHLFTVKKNKNACRVIQSTDSSSLAP